MTALPDLIIDDPSRDEIIAFYSEHHLEAIYGLVTDKFISSLNKFREYILKQEEGKLKNKETLFNEYFEKLEAYFRDVILASRRFNMPNTFTLLYKFEYDYSEEAKEFAKLVEKHLENFIHNVKEG